MTLTTEELSETANKQQLSESFAVCGDSHNTKWAWKHKLGLGCKKEIYCQHFVTSPAAKPIGVHLARSPAEVGGNNCAAVLNRQTEQLRLEELRAEGGGGGQRNNPTRRRLKGSRGSDM